MSLLWEAYQSHRLFRGLLPGLGRSTVRASSTAAAAKIVVGLGRMGLQSTLGFMRLFPKRVKSLQFFVYCFDIRLHSIIFPKSTRLSPAMISTRFYPTPRLLQRRLVQVANGCAMVAYKKIEAGRALEKLLKTLFG